MTVLARLASLALFLLLLGCSTARPASDDRATRVGERSLRLGIVGDQTLAADLDTAYAVLARGVDELARYHRKVAALDAVVHVGDLVESAEAPEAVAARFAEAAAILDRLPVPWYPAAGDHDVDPPAYEPGSADRSRRELFVRLVGARVPAAEGADGLLHYAVDLGGWRLIVLDSQEVAHAEPRWGDVFLARIGEGQLAWLAAELAASDAPAVVALHQPQWLAWSGWQRVHELLRRHPVAAVVSGHLHHPQDGGILDGIRYLTVGATGGATRRGSRAAGDVDHVTVLEVTAAGETAVTLLPLDGRPLALPGRRDMERAQALDVMLGTLWDLPARTPLHLASGGALVADCATLAPAELTLDRLGNPIDRDVTLTIDLPKTIELETAGFAPGFCRPQGEGGGGGGEKETARALCVLPPPSPNVRFSNPSGVELAPEPPLWQAILTPAPAATPLSTPLHLMVTVTWRPEAPDPSPLWLRRQVDLPVSPCP
jgi:hypothetical protein